MVFKCWYNLHLRDELSYEVINKNFIYQLLYFLKSVIIS